MYKSTFSSAVVNAFSFSQASKIRSIPAANPIPGVGFPPNCSIRRSYLPPPQSALCDPTFPLTISNVVLV